MLTASHDSWGCSKFIGLQDLWRLVARPHEYAQSLLAVSVKDPKTKEFEIVRTSLLPCALGSWQGRITFR